MRATALRLSLMTVTCCAVVLSDAKANARNVNVPEICMAVTVPDGHRACLSLSPTWGYIHGVEFDTDPSRDCAKNRPAIGERMIGIWRNANPGDDTARSYIKSECEGAKNSLGQGSRRRPCQHAVCLLHRFKIHSMSFARI